MSQKGSYRYVSAITYPLIPTIVFGGLKLARIGQSEKTARSKSGRSIVKQSTLPIGLRTVASTILLRCLNLFTIKRDKSLRLPVFQVSQMN